MSCPPVRFPCHRFFYTLAVILCPCTCSSSQGTLRYTKRTPMGPSGPYRSSVPKFPREHMCIHIEGGNSWRSSTGIPLETFVAPEISRDSFSGSFCKRRIRIQFRGGKAGRNICCITQMSFGEIR